MNDSPDVFEAPRPRTRWAAHALTALQAVVTIGLLVWLFHDPERRTRMAEALAEADWRWMIAALAAAGVCEFFGIVRWQLLLRMLKVEVPVSTTMRLFFIGAFYNQFLPGTTGGDVVRVLYLMQDHPERKTAGFLSVAIDRLLAVLVLVLMGLAVAWWRRDWFAQSIAVGSVMGWFTVILALLLIGLIASFVLTSRHLVLRLPKRFPFRKTIIKLSTLWQLCLENRREAAWAAIHTVPMLLAYFSAFYFAARAFTDKVTLWDMTSIMPLITAVSSLPISLNGIGVREALFEEMLAELCGIPRGQGLLVSISGMFIYLIWGLVGAVFLIERLRSKNRVHPGN